MSNGAGKRLLDVCPKALFRNESTIMPYRQLPKKLVGTNECVCHSDTALNSELLLVIAAI